MQKKDINNYILEFLYKKQNKKLLINYTYRNNTKKQQQQQKGFIVAVRKITVFNGKYYVNKKYASSNIQMKTNILIKYSHVHQLTCQFHPAILFYKAKYFFQA